MAHDTDVHATIAAAIQNAGIDLPPVDDEPEAKPYEDLALDIMVALREAGYTVVKGTNDAPPDSE